MKRKRRDDYRSRCPVNIGVELFGDRWSLLVIRDLMFKGASTFNEFLEASEGIATNILSDRLMKLEEAGVLSKRPDPKDARRVRYRLTEKGLDLAPVLIEIILWAARHGDTAAPPDVVAEMKTNRKRFIEGLRKRWAGADDRREQP